jgi:hypothetical protein
MKVEFQRTGERRYAVTIHREGLPPLVMNPAPGYDPYMPHDLMHFIVESELGLEHGIFGQIANGGTAGTFRSTAEPEESQRELARRRRRAARRGDKLLQEGREDSALSERATYICLYEWLARSTDPERRKIATQMTANVKNVRGNQSKAEAQTFTETFLKRTIARLEELSSQWASLKIGESMIVIWSIRKR